MGGILLKICLIGDLSTGKTSIIKSLLGARFKRKYQPTIGADFSILNLTINETNYKVMLYDFSGDEQFHGNFSLYLQGARGCLLVFDIANRETFNNLHKWVELIDSSTISEYTPLHIFGNKLDLAKIESDIISENEIINYVATLNAKYLPQVPITYTIGSAIDRETIQKMFKYFLHSILLNS